MILFLKCWWSTAHSDKKDGDMMGFYGMCQQPRLAEKAGMWIIVLKLCPEDKSA